MSATDQPDQSQQYDRRGRHALSCRPSNLRINWRIGDRVLATHSLRQEDVMAEKSEQWSPARSTKSARMDFSTGIGPDYRIEPRRRSFAFIDSPFHKQSEVLACL